MTLARNPAIKTRLLPDGHVVLFNPQGTWAHIVNPLGALVWEFCDGEYSIDQIAETVLAVLAGAEADSMNQQLCALQEQASPEQISAFVAELLGMGLLFEDQKQQNLS